MGTSGEHEACGDADVGLAIGMLRLVRRWSQDDLAKASGVRNAAISDYERGKKSPELRTLRRLLASMGFGLAALDHARRFVGLVRLEGMLGTDAEGGVMAMAPEEAAMAARPPAAEVEAAAGAAAAAVAALARMAAVLARPAEGRERGEEDRREREGGTAAERGAERVAAVMAWRELAGLPAADLQRRAREETGAVSWAVCERACEESIAAAARDAAQGLRFGKAAVALAERANGPEAWRCRLRGYALAHLANARRVQGGLPAAEDAMAAALQSWERGGAAAGDLLDEARVLGLEAAPRKELAQLAAALGPVRSVEGRLTGGFEYAPFKTPPDLKAAEAEIKALYRRARAERQHPDALWLHELAQLDLLCGRPERAVRLLEQLGVRGAGNAEVLVDLAGAYLEVDRRERGRRYRQSDYGAAIVSCRRRRNASRVLSQATVWKAGLTLESGSARGRGPGVRPDRPAVSGPLPRSARRRVRPFPGTGSRLEHRAERHGLSRGAEEGAGT